MKRFTWMTAILGIRLALWASPLEAGEPSAEERAALQKETEALATEVLPQVAGLNGFGEFRPVRIEAKTKAELQDSLPSAMRAIYGPDQLRRRGRVLAELGFWPREFDLESGVMSLLIEVMGGGYDPQRHAFYTLLDLPATMKDPPRQKIVIAHELTHALQDQRGNMEAQLRRGVGDSDYDYVYNCVVEGMAYLTMMAVVQQVPVEKAPDPTPMLLASRQNMGAGTGFPVFARSPRYLQETLFGRAIQGTEFCQAWLRDHSGRQLVALLDSLPASGEQILHYEKYVAGDRPVTFDLAGLDGALPGAWRAYYENTLGEFEIHTLCETHEATRRSAEAVGAGWDGCRLRAFQNEGGDVAILGLSAWDSDEDAGEFRDGLSSLLAQSRGSEDYAAQEDGGLVSFVIGVPDSKDRAVVLNALSAATVSR